MATPKATSAQATLKLAQGICAQSSNVVKKVLAFNNNDVPQYLKNLREFERRSRRAKSGLVVK
jgi:hypothetical protein